MDVSQPNARALLDMEQLKTFLTVVHSGGLKPAAARVCRSQGAVSMQLKKLEAHLGTRLMTRTNQGIQLTPAGETLKEYAQRLVDLNAATLSAIGQPQLTGALRMGIPSDYLPALLQRVVVALAQHFPKLQLSVFCRRSRELQSMLALGELDMAIVSGCASAAQGTELWREEFVWSGRVSVETGPAPVALFSDDCIVRDWALADLRELKIDHRQVLSTPDMNNLLSAVDGGFAYALVPRSDVQWEATAPFADVGARWLSVNLVHRPGLQGELVSRIEELLMSQVRQT
ncbi:LysR family transcriptional regulator [Ferrimonas sp. YFM]|uniref:LysR family transcriptional regulator n=1 Tax=Ferrimonas sp. YFM TaxID=3028878 RepID=UPI0025745295|nr:LysR family transcriptional regulator [Ferrimonas sp. YFM]BDY06257.1 LysR family transcriptional regulator [Ferrimonas sp. YFM]